MSGAGDDPSFGLNREPDCCASLGDLRPSHDKTIFYQVPLTNDGPPKPYPEKSQKSPTNSSLSLTATFPFISTASSSKRYVKMPFEDKTHWCKVVQGLTNSKITSAAQLITTIKEYNPSAEFKNFEVLKTFIDKFYSETERELFFNSTLPQMIKLAIELPNLIRKPIPILQQKTNHSLFLSQQQISSLLSNAFFCTFPEEKQFLLQEFTFVKIFSHPNDKLFSRKLEKLKCLINYFERVINDTPKGVVSFERRYVEENELINWSSSDVKLRKMAACPKGTIECHGYGMLQVDFANRFIGGGALRAGLVQEEIRFVINPELMVSILFTEAFLLNEALIIAGTEQYNKYSGYADSFVYDGNYYDPTPLDEWGRRYTKIVGMDATFFRDKVRTQYRKEAIDRDLIKSYAGFMERRKLDPKNKCAIATGNWGCGVYRGDPQLKSLIQLISASHSEKDLIYYTFGDQNLSTQIKQIVEFLRLKNVSVGQLYQLLIDHGNYVTSLDMDQSMEPLFDYIQRKLST